MTFPYLSDLISILSFDTEPVVICVYVLQLNYVKKEIASVNIKTAMVYGAYSQESAKRAQPRVELID